MAEPSPSPSPSAARKELTRRYKETGTQPGVYAIRNRANGRIFVGGSMDVHGALNRARFELRMRGHRNPWLMRDWLEIGPDAFEFEVLQLVRKKDDPAQDLRADLAELLALWRAELDFDGPRGYRGPGDAA
ncbi:MAG: GIY-YIG nuclease family protein [Ramlibacter sp.]